MLVQNSFVSQRQKLTPLIEKCRNIGGAFGSRNLSFDIWTSPKDHVSDRYLWLNRKKIQIHCYIHGLVIGHQASKRTSLIGTM